MFLNKISKLFLLFPIMNLVSAEIHNELCIEVMTMKDKRILISGGGIAGFTLAYWLKQRGFSPTIVEKHPCLREGGYKVDIRGTALEVAKRMGIYQNLLEVNVNLKRSKLVTPDFKIFEFDGDLTGHCSEEDIEVNRWDLVHILSKAIGEVEIIYDDSIEKIDGRVVYFEKMQAREYDVVVGADGLYSNVRRLIFGEDDQFLRKYGIHFCVFPISNIFELERSELVYFDHGKFVAAYAVNNHSYVCLAFKSEEKTLPYENVKQIFVQQYEQIGWEIPQLITAMNNCDECYFNSIAQVRMPSWSKGRVVLIGDAAHAASAMGTSLAMVGAYVLAREIEESNGILNIAFERYEDAMRKFVEDAQDLAESNHQFITDGNSSIWMKFQLYLMRILPKWFVQFITNKGREQMKKVANGLILEQ